MFSESAELMACFADIRKLSAQIRTVLLLYAKYVERNGGSYDIEYETYQNAWRAILQGDLAQIAKKDPERARILEELLGPVIRTTGTDE